MIFFGILRLVANQSSNKMIGLMTLFCNKKIVQSNGLDFLGSLGEGSFGTVKRACFKGSRNFNVAAKFMKAATGTMSEDAFRKETDLMKGLYDQNVITLMGYVSLLPTTLCALTELS